MANRYWVGTGTWDSTNTANWSSTSTTGSTGASVPTIADDVIFDASSGACTMSTTGTRTCRSLTMTGYTNTLTLAAGTGAWTVGDASGGAFTLASGMTLSGGGSWKITFAATTDNSEVGWPITTNGKTLPAITLNGVGGKWTLQDELTSTGTVSLNAGHLDTNNQNVTSSSLSTGTGVKVLTLGSTTWTTTSNNTGVSISGSNLTLNAGTSTVKAVAVLNHNLFGVGVTWHNVVFEGAGSPTVQGLTCQNLTRTGTAVTTDGFGIHVNSVTVLGTLTITGNSQTNRVLVYSTVLGTPVVISAGAVSLTDADFMDVALVGPTGSVVTSDSFNRADGALLGATSDAASGGTGLVWSTSGGGTYPAAWGVASNGAKMTGGGASVAMALVEAGSTSMAVEATVTPDSGTYHGVCAATDNANYVMATCGASGLFRVVQAGVTLLNTGITNCTAGDVLKLVVADRTVQVWRNSTLLYTATLPTGYVGGTKGGMISLGAMTGGGSQDGFRLTAMPNVTGTRLGDCLGNSGISFQPSRTMYAVQPGSFSAPGMWASTSGGVSDNPVPPLPQDDVYLDANSAAGTYTIDMQRPCRNLDCTGFTRTLQTSPSIPLSIYGSFIYSTGMTAPSNSMSYTLRGRSSHTIDTAGKTIAVGAGFNSFTVAAPGGSYTLAGPFTMTGGSQTNNFAVLAGTFSTANYDMSVRNFNIGDTTYARTVNLGTSVVSLVTSTNSLAVSIAASGLTWGGQNAEFVIASAAPSITRVFAGGGLTFASLTYTVADSPGPLSITGNNTFGTLNIGSGRSVTLPANTNTTVGTLNVAGTLRGSTRLSGVGVSTPDTAALSISDLDVRLRVAPDAWTQQNALYIGQWNASSGPNRAWGLAVNGTLRSFAFVGSSDGTTQTYSGGSSTHSFADGAAGWIRVTRRSSDGRLQFFTAADSASMPTSWTLLNTVTSSPSGSIFNTTVPFEIGSGNSVGGVIGTYYRAQIRNNVLDDGTGIVFDVDFTQPRFDPYFVDLANGALVTPISTVANVGDGRVVFESSTAGTSATLNVTNPTQLEGVDLKDVTINGDTTLGAQSVIRTNVRGVERSPRRQGLMVGL